MMVLFHNVGPRVDPFDRVGEEGGAIGLGDLVTRRTVRVTEYQQAGIGTWVATDLARSL
ncbi:MAG: hypothetical protein AAF493_22490 [Pseudomonadota bacterium]